MIRDAVYYRPVILHCKYHKLGAVLWRSSGLTAC
ncbi:uncharacterized protein HHUB_1687 [Halobacterium hubeiense]|uniref:Uncharacterized protein n=1 Tax=Halobacterium hubeiense TaxID=1407499 RepID=A0A0U5H028_9EURY|nr:uncharacterized protein HHUB_1687 [Halobacterium hubeiense]